MISKQTLGGDFGELATYLQTGRHHVHPEQRVTWMEFRNLPTARLDVAVRLMEGASSRSKATRKPVLHLSISFAPGDPVDAELMRRVMLRTLADQGLEEHQAVIVAHHDTENPHVHAMVNRVHPETGRAWKGSWSRVRAEASLRRQELELGLRVVPGWLAPVPGQPELRPRLRLARGSSEFLREVQERATPVCERARSWSELERGLADFGLSVRVNGRGMSITDGRQEVKASEVGRAYSRQQLEKRLGRYSDYSARVAVAIGTLRQAAVDPAERNPVRAPTQGAHTEGHPPRFRLFEEDGVVGVYDSSRSHVFFAETRDGAEAAVKRANEIVARYPNIATVRSLRDMDGAWRHARGLPEFVEPDRPRFVAPAPAATAKSGPWDTHSGPIAASGANREAGAVGKEESDSLVEPVEPAIPQPPAEPLHRGSAPPNVELTVATAAEGVQPETSRSAVPLLPTVVPQRQAPLTARQVAARDLASQLTDLYVDPRGAWLALLADLQKWGADSAVRSLESDPERYGVLRPGMRRGDAIWAADATYLFAQEHQAELAKIARKPNLPHRRIKHAAGLLNQGATLQEVDEKVTLLIEEASNAESEATRLKAARDAWVELFRQVRPVYAVPREAIEAMKAHTAVHGYAETFEAVRGNPTQFGALLGRKRFWRKPDYSQALRRCHMIGPYLEYALRRAEVPPSQAEVERAAQLARTARAASVDAHATRQKLSPQGVVSFQHAAAHTIQPLLHLMGQEEVERQLRPLLTPGAASLLPKMFDTAVTLAEGRQAQREGYTI